MTSANSEITTTRHFAWCLPEFCETHGDETLHRGVPLVWRLAGDGDADVLMRRCQYGADGDPRYEVHFTHRSYPEDVTLMFTEDDVNRMFTGMRALRGCA